MKLVVQIIPTFSFSHFKFSPNVDFRNKMLKRIINMQAETFNESVFYNNKTAGNIFENMQSFQLVNGENERY